MAVRADRQLEHALIVSRTVEASQTVAVGRVVKDGNADHECQHAGANESGYGVVYVLGKLAGAAGDRVQVALLAGPVVIPVLVGTGGATRGARAVVVADGLTDGTPAAAGGTLKGSPGTFTQSGVAGDIVGLLPSPCIIETA